MDTQWLWAWVVTKESPKNISSFSVKKRVRNADYQNTKKTAVSITKSYFNSLSDTKPQSDPFSILLFRIQVFIFASDVLHLLYKMHSRPQTHFLPTPCIHCCYYINAVWNHLSKKKTNNPAVILRLVKGFSVLHKFGKCKAHICLIISLYKGKS